MPEDFFPPYPQPSFWRKLATKLAAQVQDRTPLVLAESLSDTQLAAVLERGAGDQLLQLVLQPETSGLSITLFHGGGKFATAPPRWYRWDLNWKAGMSDPSIEGGANSQESSPARSALSVGEALSPEMARSSTGPDLVDSIVGQVNALTPE